MKLQHIVISKGYVIAVFKTVTAADCFALPGQEVISTNRPAKVGDKASRHGR